MKKLKKIIVAFSMVVSMGFMSGESVLACTATPNCAATGQNVVCGTQHGSTTTHYVAYPNGHVATCVVTTISASHNIYCSGCGALLKTENRTCAIEHSDSHCFDSYNMCK